MESFSWPFSYEKFSFQFFSYWHFFIKIQFARNYTQKTKIWCTLSPLSKCALRRLIFDMLLGEASPTILGDGSYRLIIYLFLCYWAGTTWINGYSGIKGMKVIVGRVKIQFFESRSIWVSFQKFSLLDPQ